QLGHDLQVEIDRQPKVLAGLKGFGCKHLAHLAAIVDDYLPLSVYAGQPRVVLPLDAEFSNNVARIILGEVRRIELRLADFSRVSNDMREHPVLGVEAL